MWLLQGFLDRSKQLNQTPNFVKYPEYHPPNNKYKIVHQGLILPNLPAPLHYVNFLSIIGQPNIPTLLNPNTSFSGFFISTLASLSEGSTSIV